MSPRNSQVDVVQAVGRAMRKADGKQYGYIVLPVAVPAGTDPDLALNDNERFAAVWSVLRALRSHDDRLDAEINKIDLNEKRTDRIIIGGDGNNGEQLLPFPPLDLPPGAIYAKDRREVWRSQVLGKAGRRMSQHIFTQPSPPYRSPPRQSRINETLGEWFEAFHLELKGLDQ